MTPPIDDDDLDLSLPDDDEPPLAPADLILAELPPEAPPLAPADLILTELPPEDPPPAPADLVLTELPEEALSPMDLGLSELSASSEAREESLPPRGRRAPQAGLTDEVGPARPPPATPTVVRGNPVAAGPVPVVAGTKVAVVVGTKPPEPDAPPAFPGFEVTGLQPQRRRAVKAAAAEPHDTEKAKCPECGFYGVPIGGASCRNCGTRIRRGE